MSGSAKSRNHRREAYRRAVNLVYKFLARSSAARARRRVFSLDNRLTWMSAIHTLSVGCVRLALVREVSRSIFSAAPSFGHDLEPQPRLPSTELVLPYVCIIHQSMKLL